MMKIGLLAVALAFGQAQPVEEPVRFRVAASGDFLIHTPVAARARVLGGGSRYDFAPLFDPIKQHIEGADLAICHVETPLVPGPPAGYPVFRTPVGLAGSIKRVGWDVCSTASNHSLDVGEYGIGTTLRALDRAGVPHHGTARSPAERRRAPITDVKGVKVAVLAYTAISNGQVVPNPWNLNWASAGRILADAKSAKRAGAEAVILNMHWGNEYQHSISPAQLSLARTAHPLTGPDRDRRPARPRRPADPKNQRQAGGIRRGQPRVQSDRRVLPRRVAGRADRPDRLRRAVRRAGQSHPRPLRTDLRESAELQRAAGRPRVGVVEPDRERGRAAAGHPAAALRDAMALDQEARLRRREEARERQRKRRRNGLIAALAAAVGVAGIAAVAVIAGGGGDDDREAASEERQAEALPEEPVSLTIAASGDLLIHSPVFLQALANGGGERYQFRPMLGQVREIVRQADLGICHLEEPLTPDDPHGEPTFRAPAGLAGAIRWTGWDACSTASNHAFDSGQPGIDFTVKRLDRNRIAHSGTNAKPGTPHHAMIEAKGVKVALLAYTTRIIGMPLPDNDWALNMAEPKRMLADARAARRSRRRRGDRLAALG